MQGESRYLIHPSSIDACLQLIIISINAGKHKEMACGVVPTRLEEVTLFPARLGGEDAAVGHAVAWTDGFEGRRFNTNVRLTGEDERVLMDIKNLTCTAYEAALPARPEIVGEGENNGPEPFSVMAWKPDVETLRDEDVELLWPTVSNNEKLAKCVELIAHRDGVPSVLIIAPDSTSTTQDFVDAIIGAVPDETTVTVGATTDKTEDEAVVSDPAQSRVQQITLGIDPTAWATTVTESYDLVIVAPDAQTPGLATHEPLLSLVGTDGWLMCPSHLVSSVSPKGFLSLKVGEHTLIRETSSHLRADEVTLLSTSKVQLSDNILSGLQVSFTVHEKAISESTVEHDNHVIVDDRTGSVSASILSSEPHFESFKRLLSSGASILWLTQGVRQGRPAGDSGASGIAEGLLRVIRSEQAAVKVTLLDIDQEESSADVCRAITHALGSIATKDSGCDTEFWLHRGVMFVSRVETHTQLNHDLQQSRPQKMPLSGALKLVNTTTEGEFVFESQYRGELVVLADEEVEVQVLASSWPSCSPGSRMLVLGSVIRVGASVDQNLTGKRVMAFAYDSLQTVFSTSAYAVIGDDACDEAADARLLRSMSSLYPLVHLCLGSTKLEKGAIVISLPGPERDMKMLEQLSKAMGWQLTVVAETDANAVNALIQSQRSLSSSGIVTVLAHDFDARLAQEVWRHIPPSCRFLLLSEKPLETALDPLPFSRGASFVPSSIKHLRDSAAAISSLLATSLELVKTHSSLLELSVVKDVIDIEDARQVSKSAGKERDSGVVVRYRPEASQVLVRFHVSHHPQSFNEYR